MYDGHDRLTQAFTTADTWQTANACSTAPTDATLGNGPAPYWQTYSYDVLGNRTGLVRHATTAGGSDTTTTYGYGSPAGSPNGTQPHTLTSSTTTQPSVPDKDNAYGYDADGNRLLTRDANGTTLFLGDTEIHLDKGTSNTSATLRGDGW